MPTNDPNHPLGMSDAELALLDKQPDADREARLETLLSALENSGYCAAIATITGGVDLSIDTAKLALEVAGLLLDLDRKDESVNHSRPTIQSFIQHKAFEQAATACQYVYLADTEDAVAAIGQAAWLAVSYPVDPYLTATILDHIIDETPDASDGAAVAAATAHYVADMRADDSNREDLLLFTGAMLARAARRHSGIEDQAEFEQWVVKLELDTPEQFLGRLRNVIDVLVQDLWWFDRETLQADMRNDE